MWPLRANRAQAVQEVERYYRDGLAVGVSRSFADPGGEGVVNESTRHAISAGVDDMPDEMADGFVAAMQRSKQSKM